MVARRGAFVNPSNTSEELRLAQAGQLVRNADRSIRTGVLGGPMPWSILNSRTTMAVGVSPFAAVVSRSAAYGAVVLPNDGDVEVTLAAAPASNSRIDVVWVRQRDTTQGDANSDAEIGVTAGTAAASPVKPSIPVGALELGTVLVPAGVTGTNAASVVISSTHLWTNAAGGVVAVRNQTEQTAFAAANGQIIHRLDTGLFFGRVGGAWVQMGEQSQVRQWGLARSSVPTGTSATTFGVTTEDTTVRTAVFPNVTFNSSTNTWTLATSGWYTIDVTGSIALDTGGASGGASSQLRVVSGSSDLAASSFSGIRTTATTARVYSDGTRTFQVDAAHNSGAPRNMTGTLRVTRTGGLG